MAAGRHYIGFPFGVHPPEIFPLGHKPTRREIGVVYANVLGPYMREEAESAARAVRGYFVLNPSPFAKRGD